MFAFASPQTRTIFPRQAVQLHFALFNGYGGYVLKPPEMMDSLLEEDGLALISNDIFWPPPRQKLTRTTIDVVSLHHLPKVHLGMWKDCTP